MLAVECRYQYTTSKGFFSLKLNVSRTRLADKIGLFGEQSFESLNSRSVAVVIDPIQSVKGKVVIDAFRLINPSTVISGKEPRQTTSNIGHINKPSIQALIHGLNRHYYSIAVNYRKTELEQSMLMNLHKRNWTEGLKLRNFNIHKEDNEKAIKVRSPIALRRGENRISVLLTR
jgi:26S proteasome regulatory subunit N11